VVLPLHPALQPRLQVEMAFTTSGAGTTESGKVEFLPAWVLQAGWLPLEREPERLRGFRTVLAPFF
jgi:hypothetical protein